MNNKNNDTTKTSHNHLYSFNISYFQIYQLLNFPINLRHIFIYSLIASLR